VAAESVDLWLGVDQNEIFASRPDTETGRGERTEEVEDVDNIEVPGLGHETTHETLDTPVVKGHRSGGGIEALTSTKGGLFDIVRQVEERREGIGELHDAHGRHDGCEAGKGGDGGSNDKGDRPLTKEPRERAGILIHLVPIFETQHMRAQSWPRPLAYQPLNLLGGVIHLQILPRQPHLLPLNIHAFSTSAPRHLRSHLDNT